MSGGKLKRIENNIVKQVVVVSNDIATTEENGIEFLNNLYRFVPRKDFSPTLSWQERQKLEKEWVRKSRKDNYFVRTEVGYDEYYVINSVLADKKPVAEITEKMTANKMANIFSKKNNQFKAKRIILSKFVDLITAK